MNLLGREKKVCRRCQRPIPYLNGKFVDHDVQNPEWGKEAAGLHCIGSGEYVDGNSSEN